MAEAPVPDGPNLVPAAIAVWAGYAFYWYWIMLGTSAPGEPAWNTSPETAHELLDESINYFYLNIFLHYVGGDAFPSPVCHPVSEGLFNFVNAWSLMFGPLMARDEGGRRNGLNGTALWLAANFLTNVFMIPFMALRLGNNGKEIGGRKLSVLDKAVGGSQWGIGAVGGAMGAISLVWMAVGRGGDFGSIADRLEVWNTLFSTDRVTYAFVFDMCLYTIFQAWLMGAQMPADSPKRWLRFVPFFGMAAWMVSGEEPGADAEMGGGD